MYDLTPLVRSIIQEAQIMCCCDEIVEALCEFMRPTRLNDEEEIRRLGRCMLPTIRENRKLKFALHFNKHVEDMSYDEIFRICQRGCSTCIFVPENPAGAASRRNNLLTGRAGWRSERLESPECRLWIQPTEPIIAELHEISVYEPALDSFLITRGICASTVHLLAEHFQLLRDGLIHLDDATWTHVVTSIKPVVNAFLSFMLDLVAQPQDELIATSGYTEAMDDMMDEMEYRGLADLCILGGTSGTGMRDSGQWWG